MLLKRNQSIGKLFRIALLTGVLASFSSAQVLTNVETSSLGGGDYSVSYYFNGPIVEVPNNNYLEDRDLLVLDFKASGITQDVKNKTFNSDTISGVQNVYVNDRIRSTLRLAKPLSYTVNTHNNMVTINLKDTQAYTEATSSPNWEDLATQSQNVSHISPLRDIDFRRNSRGAGVVDIALPDASTQPNIIQEKNRIRVQLTNRAWDPGQNRRIDVTDFATPVSAVEVVNGGGHGFVDIYTQASHDYTAQQINGNKYRVTVSPKIAHAPIAPQNIESQSSIRGGNGWTGEPISINFQDIDVRAVLQIIADYTGLNMVVSDSVSSRITIKLTNVPWDQALDTVLLYSGLGQARNGNVIFVAPQDQLSQFEGVNLQTELIQINYADAENIAQVIASRVGGGSSRSGSSSEGAGLSEHGSVSVDNRTNKLIVQDTSRQIRIIRELIAELDKPVRQVQIAAEIVAAFDDFARDLGVTWGANYQKGRHSVGGSNMGSSFGGGISDAISLGVSGRTSSLQYMVLGRELQLGLELSAMQTENRGETLASPVVLTTDRQTAYIKQGSEVAYSTVSDSGTNVEFKEIVMELNVTPRITPDDKIIMDILVTKDEIDGFASTGEPIIGKKELNTQALVADGETIVLGGIYERAVSRVNSKVPFFGDLPLLGNLFKRQENQNKKAELLIFVTPNIIDIQKY